jgi:hypothetical protein
MVISLGLIRLAAAKRITDNLLDARKNAVKILLRKECNILGYGRKQSRNSKLQPTLSRARTLRTIKHKFSLVAETAKGRTLVYLAQASCL